jgi:hypothetical protein
MEISVPRGTKSGLKNSIVRRGTAQCSLSILNSPRRKSQKISFHTITQLFRTRKKFAVCVEIKITAYALGFPVERHAKFDYLLGWLNQLCAAALVFGGAAEQSKRSTPAALIFAIPAGCLVSQ